MIRRNLDKISVEDVVGVLERNYRKLLKVNLATRLHEEILIAPGEDGKESGFSKYIDGWLEDFASKGNIHPDDVEEFRIQADIEKIRAHFLKRDDVVVIRYRRKIDDQFRWVHMNIHKSLEYTDDNPIVLLYVLDKDREMSQDALINSVLVSCIRISRRETIDDEKKIRFLLNEIKDFYDADSVVLDENGAVRMEGERQNTDTLLVERMVASIITNILISQEEKERRRLLEEQYSIINSLSEVYFSVYHAKLYENKVNKIYAPEYLEKLFGEGNSISEIFYRMETYLVSDEYKETVHEFNNLDYWQEHLKEKDVISTEFVGQNRGWTKASVIVVRRDESNVVTEILYAVSDIDEEKSREAQINKTLREALETAQKASEAKTAFLSNVSHDIRTPMNAIIGYTNLAAAHIEGENGIELTKGYIERVSTAGKHLMNLINSVLDMSRIESGRMILTEVECDITELAEEIKGMVFSQIEEKEQKFIIDTSGVKNKNVFCDSLRLNQVVINIVGNAVKFTDRGGEISLSVSEEKGNVQNYPIYEIRVKDNGIGMEKDFIGRVFEPFERERTATQSGIQGTGLGLAISRNIVTLMNGTIDVKSEKGKGTEFIVRVPLRTAKQSGVGKKEKGSLEKMKKEFVGLRVLLVDDNELNRDIGSELLSDEGMLVETAGDGLEAINMLQSKGEGYYDLVLMDVQMPGMDGLEATRRIRRFKEDGLRTIPVIAMTASAFEEDKRNALKAGMNAFLPKPVDVDLFIETVNEVMV